MFVDEDFPTVGLSEFDLWITKVMFILVIEYQIYTPEDWFLCFEREHWLEYYNSEMTPKQAVDEELSYWGD